MRLFREIFKIHIFSVKTAHKSLSYKFLILNTGFKPKNQNINNLSTFG